jgi:hypothetical protein
MRITLRFIHAANSRDKLKITRTMLSIVLTYHQAMAPFLDFFFSFGKQDYPHEFHFSGLYHESRFTSDQPSLELPQLGRSGKCFQMCYNLKSVESSSVQPHFPWSVRILAVHHSFDVVTGKTFWTIVKGDELIKRRIKTATRPSNRESLDISSPSMSFSLTLDVQLIIFDWCREKLRWYISFFEELQEETTCRALTTSFDRPSARSPIEPLMNVSTDSPSNLKRRLTQLKRRVASATGTLSEPFQPSFPQPTPPPREFEPDPRDTQIFSISDLQSMVKYEEKIKELLLVIRSNIKIVTGVKLYYMEVIESPEFPNEIKTGSRRKLEDFSKAVTSIVNDLEMQYSRADMLLSTLTSRKGLVSAAIKSTLIS